MRCVDCNANLTDEESVRKDENTGSYLDLCNDCLSNLYRDLYDDLPDDTLDEFLDLAAEEEAEDGR